MNTQSINQCPKVWKRVQLCLEASPVIARFPILHQRSCSGDGNPVRPVLYWMCVGESGRSQARSEIVNGFLRNRDMKQTDCSVASGISDSRTFDIVALPFAS